jgi:hypothetical protein
MRLAQALVDTPDRKAFAKEQMALRNAESQDKRRQLEDNMKVLNENNDLSVNRCLLPAWRKGTLVFFEGDLYL